jgi:NADH:ubiquinone oxidoreductase subunit C
MYGINFFFKNDTRRLLLDYTKVEHPLLKNFQSEGFNETFYNILDNQVCTLFNESVEL